MFRKFIKLIIFIIEIISFFFEKLFKINFKGFLTSELRHEYKIVHIKNRNIKFFLKNIKK